MWEKGRLTLLVIHFSSAYLIARHICSYFDASKNTTRTYFYVFVSQIYDPNPPLPHLVLIIALGISISPRQLCTIMAPSGRGILLIITGTNLPVWEGKTVARFMWTYDTGGDSKKHLISTVYTGYTKWAFVCKCYIRNLHLLGKGLW